MALSAVDILATIRDNASDNYIKRVPEATRNNLQQVGEAITGDMNILNEFMESLIDKIAYSNVLNKMFRNPFAILKKNGVPRGNAIEEIYVNPSTDVGFQTDQNMLLKTTKPDGKTAYYSLARKSTYPQTINKTSLMTAFNSEADFMSLYNGFVTALYSGDEIDEFMLIKGLLASTIDNGSVTMIENDIKQPKELMKAISNVSKAFTFPSSKFNGYNLVNADKITGGEKECITWTPSKEQCLIIRADVQTEINFEVLATMFHMDLAELEAMTILVDDIPSKNYDVYAFLCDTNAIQVRDKILTIENHYNGATLDFNYWLHHWEYIFLSMFGNACGFGKPKTTSSK